MLFRSVVFIAVMLLYSVPLTLIVLVSLPLYLLISDSLGLNHKVSVKGGQLQGDHHGFITPWALSCSITPRITSRAMNNGYRLESIQSSGTRQLLNHL